jgi:hypothetical protein
MATATKSEAFAQVLKENTLAQILEENTTLEVLDLDDAKISDAGVDSGEVENRHTFESECLKYAHENGCPWDEETYESAESEAGEKHTHAPRVLVTTVHDLAELIEKDGSLSGVEMTEEVWGAFCDALATNTTITTLNITGEKRR